MSIETLKISYFRDGSNEFMEMLSDSSIEWSMRQKFPEGTLVASSELIEILKVIGGASIIPSLAAIIVEWLKRNRSREVVVKFRDFTVVHLRGYSTKDVEKILEKTNDLTIIQTKPDERT
ncbi:hypothetical protein [Vibrio furnissii]|uniref:hypothetical protein n=1 Tax=Vibrio furnissii TaxID=29494 RepID=UPI001E372CBD|nr:hypothetical protein [Vibrio furnissii]UHJ63244.1 hypothetical protein LUM42_19785 [Vibrio furnissii]